MKCPSCTTFLMESADKCSCGYVIIKPTRNDLCDKCKRRRGRKIILQKATEHRQEKSKWICYDCYHAQDNKRFHQAPNFETYKTKEEASFAKELDNYQRALFYEDAPDNNVLEKAGVERNKKIYGGI